MSWRIRDASAFADALAMRLSTAALGPSPTFQVSLRMTLITEAALVFVSTSVPTQD